MAAAIDIDIAEGCQEYLLTVNEEGSGSSNCGSVNSTGAENDVARSSENGMISRRHGHGQGHVSQCYSEFGSHRVASASASLNKLKIFLRWLGLYHPSRWRLIFGRIAFVLFTIVVPSVAMLWLSCLQCSEEQVQLDIVVQASESALAVISFLFLSHNMRKHGLQYMLFSQVEKEPRKIQLATEKQISAALKLLAFIVFPCLLGKTLYEIWWFTKVSFTIPFFEDKAIYHIIITVVILLSWLYRMSLFLFVCTVFRLVCTLQLLSFEKFENSFQQMRDIYLILEEHMHIREKLLTISHRYRVFILSSLVAITFSQIVSLFITTAYSWDVDFIRAGNLVVCATVQVTGFVLCLHGAARITHRAQSTVSKVSVWHALETCRSSDSFISKPRAVHLSHFIDVDQMYLSSSDNTEDNESMNDVNVPGPSYVDSSSFQKRQALVSYLRHSSAGISIYGFVLDRGFIYTLFGLELSMVLFILGLTLAVN